MFRYLEDYIGKTSFKSVLKNIHKVNNINDLMLIVNKYNKVTSSVGYFIYGAFFIHLISIYLFIYDPMKVSLFIFLIITVTSILINLAVFLSVFAFKYAQKHFASVSCLMYFMVFPYRFIFF